jgi:hypothetical protein
LKTRLGESKRRRLLDRYRDQTVRLSIQAQQSSVVTLPREEREIIYDRVRGIAQRHGLQVSICGCKNPDLADGCCGIAGERPAEPELFD